MRSAVFVLAAIAATAHAAATPWSSWGTKKTTSNCMSDNDATKVANNFKTLIDNYSDSLANASLTKDFVDYSDSVGELINGGCTTGGSVKLGDATFSSRAEFEAAQGAQPAIPFKILNQYNNCNSVTIRWVSKGEGQEPQQVTGIIIMETKKNPDNKSNQKWLISKVYSEFNSGAWLVNLGVFVPPQCPPPPPPSKMLKRSIFV